MRRIKHLTHTQLATLSEYELESRSAACIARGKTWRTLSVACVSCVVVFIGIALVPAFRIAMTPDATIRSVELLVLVPLMLFGLALMLLGCALDALCRVPVLAWARELEPLAESESGCSKLLAAAREFPRVTLWVDAAISNGRQLRRFDLTAAKDMISEDEVPHRKDLNAAACRELHGVPAAG